MCHCSLWRSEVLYSSGSPMHSLFFMFHALPPCPSPPRHPLLCLKQPAHFLFFSWNFLNSEFFWRMRHCRDLNFSLQYEICTAFTCKETLHCYCIKVYYGYLIVFHATGVCLLGLQLCLYELNSQDTGNPYISF